MLFPQSDLQACRDGSGCIQFKDRPLQSSRQGLICPCMATIVAMVTVILMNTDSDTVIKGTDMVPATIIVVLVKPQSQPAQEVELATPCRQSFRIASAEAVTAETPKDFVTFNTGLCR